MLTLFLGICLLFISSIPAHAWTQTDWVSGDSQCLWYAADRYDTGVSISVDNPTGAVSMTDTGIVALWHFNEGSGTKAYDATSNNNDGDLTGAPTWGTIAEDSAVWEYGLSFDGSDDYVNCGSDTSLYITNEITIEAWVKAKETGDAQVIFSQGGSWLAGTRLYINASGGLIFIFFNGTIYQGYDVTTSYADYFDEWTHIAATFKYLPDGNSPVTIYINGVQKQQDLETKGAPNPLAGALIGVWSPPSYYFNGAIDEVRIYSRALSADEIAAHADTSIIETLGDNSLRGVLLSSTFDASSPVVWKTIEWNNPSTSTLPYERGDSRLRKDETTGLVALWHFDEGVDVSGKSADDSTVYDESTNSNTGIVYGCVWGNASEDSAVFQSGLTFNGSSDYVDCGSKTSLNITSAITIEAWVKTTAFTASADQGIVMKRSSFWGTGGYGINIWSTGSWVFSIDGADGNIKHVAYTNTVLNTWSHVAGTYDGQTLRLYWNGVEKKTLDYIGSILSNSVDVEIGKLASVYYNGAIDEVAIYNYAKTAEEIWQDARGTQIRLRTQTTSSILDGTGADSAVGLWHFDDDATSSTADDSSVYNKDGSLGSGASWYQWGVFGKCVKLDGTANGNVSWSSSIGNIKSIEFWMNSDGAADDSAILELASGDTVYISDAGNIETSFGDTIIYVDGSSGSASVDAGTWHHVAITTPTEKSASALKLGKAGTGYFSGLIDELGLYNKVRSSTQIARDARSGSPWSRWSPYYKKGDEDDVVLYKDNFNDGDVGIGGYWQEYGNGTWLIDNIVADTGNLQISGLSIGDTAIIIAENTDWYDEQVEVKVKIKTALGKAGIIYRKSDTNHGYVAYLEEGYGVKDYLMSNTGPYELKGSSSVTINTNTWYTLKVTSDGTRDRVYVDGNEKISFSNTSTHKGKAGLYAEDKTAVFDDFKVFPIDRYVRYEATLTDNMCNATPYLYWVRLTYEDTTSDDSIWSRVWQDKYGTHTFESDPDVTFCPKDGTAGGELNDAEIDSADTVWCYNLENYGNQAVGLPPVNPLKVYVSTPADTISRVDLRLGIRKTSAPNYPDEWPEDKDNYSWSDWRQHKRSDMAGTDLDESGDGIDTWLLTYSTTHLATDFATEGGYVLQSRAVSNSESTEPDPATFKPDSGDRADTSIIYVMRDITPPGSASTGGGVDGATSASGYTAETCANGYKNTLWTNVGVKGIDSENKDITCTSYRTPNSKYVWFNIESSADDSGIRVKVVDQNQASGRTNDCSDIDEADSSIRYTYSLDGGSNWYNKDDSEQSSIPNVADWLYADTNIWTDRYIVIKDAPAEVKTLDGGTGTGSYRYSIATLAPGTSVQNSTKGDLVLIQFAQKDKAGNWGYSHRAASHYATEESGMSLTKGYFINVDLTAPKPIITAGPRERNYSTYASFKFEDDADDSPLLCAFSTRLERDTHDSSFNNAEVFDGNDWTDYSPWSPTSHEGDPVTFTGLSSSKYGHWYRCFVKARDEALNPALAPLDTADSAVYVFQCLLPVPNTIIYSGPSGIVTTDTLPKTYTFKYRGEGGSTTPYKFNYCKDGSSWEGWSTDTSTTYTVTKYGNYTFRVKAANGVASPDSDDEDQTPACVTFTIENPDKPSAIAPPGDPVKYWREESE